MSHLHHLTIDGHPFAVPHTSEGGVTSPVPQHRPPAILVTAADGSVWLRPVSERARHEVAGRRVAVVSS